MRKFSKHQFGTAGITVFFLTMLFVAAGCTVTTANTPAPKRAKSEPAPNPPAKVTNAPKAQSEHPENDGAPHADDKKDHDRDKGAKPDDKKGHDNGNAEKPDDKKGHDGGKLEKPDDKKGDKKADKKDPDANKKKKGHDKDKNKHQDDEPGHTKDPADR